MIVNPNLSALNENFLYLLQFDLNQENLAKFSGIKHVIMQGSSKRAENLAVKLASKISKIDTRFFKPINLVNTSNFAVYRVGNILSVSHGMGNVTIDALLHELTKLLHYAGNQDFNYIRVGTSGGIGLEPGTIVVTKQSFMPNLQAYYTTYELDKQIDLPTQFDAKLVEEIINAQPKNLPFNVVVGNSIAADDFYLGQCRYDGAMKARQTHEWRNEFFKKIQALDIYNFEMESTALAAFCGKAKIPATMIAVTLLNRLDGDQVTSTAEQLGEYSDRSHEVVMNYLLNQETI